jgi:tetratricopeptide (TPR) repeat protein
MCTSCGALTRGLFRGLDLGTPQLARAVANGLDFYLLLGVPNDADTRTIARRFRQLRVLFPDDPRHLAPEPARRLELLELAGRTLTDPRLRATYDDLRAGSAADLKNTAQRCAGCAAPLPQEATRCSFCGTPRPPAPQPPDAPPSDAGPPPSEPVDYYAVLGLNAVHLLDPASSRSSFGGFGGGLLGIASRAADAPLLPEGPPSPADVDAACLERQKAILLMPGYTPAERDARMDELEMARRILRDERRRAQYDMLLVHFRQGLYGAGRLDGLRHLQDLVRADMAEERGEAPPLEQGMALLKQGQGFLDARLPREALEPLRRAVAALPQSAEAHATYVRATLAADDPLALGGHALRMLERSLDALANLQPATPQQQAIATLCQGLIARDDGQAATARAHIQQAVALDPQLAPAWRGLAALALSRGDLPDAVASCQRAIALDARDEHALLMLGATLLRGGRRHEARDVAAQLAALRADGSSAESILREIGG